MGNNLYHPAEANITPLVNAAGLVTENNGVRDQRYMLQLCRDEAKKAGYELAAVWVVNRRTKACICWSLNSSIGVNFAESLCSGNWRIATQAEAAAAREAMEAERVAIHAAQLNYQDAAIRQLAGVQHFQHAVDSVLAAQPASAKPAGKGK